MPARSSTEWQDVMLGGKIGERKASTCRITTSDGTYFTGFLINFEGHPCIATCNHVMPTIEEALACKVEFDVEEHVTLPGVAKIPFEVKLNPGNLWLTCDDEDLDFTFVGAAVHIAPEGFVTVEMTRGPNRRLEPMALSVDDPRSIFGDALVGMGINIVQHPDGDLKKSMAHLVDRVDGNYIYYNEDTGHGVSGSPVFFNRWEVLAMHNQRDPRKYPDAQDQRRGVAICAIAQYAQAWFDARRQLMVLVDIYQACDGENWRNKATWCTDTPIGDWEGVITDEDEEITTLDLNNKRLCGLLPTSLNQCQRMVKLDMSNNKLFGTYETGGIPECIGNLPNLKILKLYSNKLEGEIPHALSKLHKLEVLWLNRNQLMGAIPPSIGQLQNLTALYLSYNKLAGPIPSTLGDLHNLELLDLGYNTLTGDIPDSLGFLLNLRELYLFHNKLTGTVPESFVNLKKLNTLAISNNKLHDIEEARELMEEEFGKKVNMRWL
jgi:Leucine-rich repeat (LRR) protein